MHAKFHAVVDVESRDQPARRRAAARLLAGVAIAGVALASRRQISIAQLVTLFLVTATFVGQIAMVARHLPELQAGLGAVIRLRQMLVVAARARRRQPAARRVARPRAARPALLLPEGTFALQGVDLRVPAGHAVRPGRPHRLRQVDARRAASRARSSRRRGTVFLGGVDVLDLDLQRLRLRSAS